MPIVITRFANIYGPGQLNFSALIPDVIKCGLRNEEFLPRGNGNSKRDFLYVKDVAELYCIIAESLSRDKSHLKGEIYNAGTNEEKSVREVVENIFKILKNDIELEKIFEKLDNNSPILEGKIYFQSMDYKKVERYFRWKPKTAFLDGLNQTIKWYNDYLLSENCI